MEMQVIQFMTVSYSINGQSIRAEELKEVRIARKDYIDYIEAIRHRAQNCYREQDSERSARETGKVQGIG